MTRVEPVPSAPALTDDHGAVDATLSAPGGTARGARHRIPAAVAKGPTVGLLEGVVRGRSAIARRIRGRIALGGRVGDHQMASAPEQCRREQQGEAREARAAARSRCTTLLTRRA